MGFLRKVILLSLPVMFILAASSCGPERPWAAGENFEINGLLKGDKRCCALKNFESGSAIGKY